MDSFDSAECAPDQGLPPLAAADLTEAESAVIVSGPVVMRLRSNDRTLWRDVATMYAGYPGGVADADNRVADFTVELHNLRHPALIGTRRLAFRVNGGPVLSMQPARLGFALFEWGANWCVSTYGQAHLSIHAAVVERHGLALVLPGPPGSGKSTLCATLVARGWRLLTDETALLRLSDGMVIPVVRPISLKNRSIDVLQALWPDATFGRRFDETDKGTVAHVRPPDSSIAGMYAPVPVGAVIFPTYEPGQEVCATAQEKAAAFMFLASNSFNYDVLGRPAFDCLAGVIENSRALKLRYGDGTTAAAWIEADWP